MSTAIAKQTEHALSVGEQFFTAEQERIILNTFLGGASKDEAQVLLATVQRRRLDPFSRQVYFVKRWDASKREEVWAIQTSIDGLRSIAERTGKYDGQDEPAYGEDDAGKFCKVKVYRKDWSSGRAAVGVAYLEEFIQRKRDGTITQFWSRMPRLMLAKCAEALAIRKAFPEDTGGLYVAEEMGQDPEPLEVAARPAPPKALESRQRPLAPEVVTETAEVRDHAAHLAAAAEALGGTIESTKPIASPADPALKHRAMLLWKRAHDAKTHNMTRTMFEAFVRTALDLPADDPLPLAYSAEQLDTLESALTKQETVPF